MQGLVWRWLNCGHFCIFAERCRIAASLPRRHPRPRRSVEIGRQVGLKNRWSQGHEGSSPSSGTLSPFPISTTPPLAMLPLPPTGWYGRERQCTWRYLRADATKTGVPGHFNMRGGNLDRTGIGGGNRSEGRPARTGLVREYYFEVWLNWLYQRGIGSFAM